MLSTSESACKLTDTKELYKIADGSVKSIRNKYNFDFCHEDYLDMRQEAIKTILEAPTGMPEKYYFVVARRAALFYILWWKLGITVDKARSVPGTKFLVSFDEKIEKSIVSPPVDQGCELNLNEMETLKNIFTVKKNKRKAGYTFLQIRRLRSAEELCSATRIWGSLKN